MVSCSHLVADLTFLSVLICQLSVEGFYEVLSGCVNFLGLRVLGVLERRVNSSVAEDDVHEVLVVYVIPS